MNVRLTDRAYHALRYVGWHIDHMGGEAVFSLKMIANRQACSMSTARRVVGEMLECGWAEIRHVGGRGDSSLYQLTWRGLGVSDGPVARAAWSELEEEFAVRRHARIWKASVERMREIRENARGA